jgi:hypothetical protein
MMADRRWKTSPASAQSRHNVLAELHLANAPATERLGRPLSIDLIASTGARAEPDGVSRACGTPGEGGAAAVRGFAQILLVRRGPYAHAFENLILTLILVSVAAMIQIIPQVRVLIAVVPADFGRSAKCTQQCSRRIRKLVASCHASGGSP